MNKICYTCKAININEANYCRNCGSQALATADDDILGRTVELEKALNNYKDKNLTKASPENTKIFIMTNGMLLNSYKKSSDKVNDVKNFRLYCKNKATNLIWYNGQIIFVPQEYFELKNLVNIDINKKQKCSLHASEFSLIKEIEEQNIQFVLEPNLNELLRRMEMSGIQLDDEVTVEFIDDNDYSSINEPIYLGDGLWMNTSG
ncbi:hypothetical protein SAMN06313540_10227 [Epsilonproteobacteria bacterium SCGC AD-308-E02]|jgi:hypothetical protein|nr:hypothetical protein SAMN06313540_10227 [Epsilonproteobacteria bacterium SCGC AD-308-E02]